MIISIFLNKEMKVLMVILMTILSMRKTMEVLKEMLMVIVMVLLSMMKVVIWGYTTLNGNISEYYVPIMLNVTTYS